MKWTQVDVMTWYVSHDSVSYNKKLIIIITSGGRIIHCAMPLLWDVPEILPNKANIETITPRQLTYL